MNNKTVTVGRFTLLAPASFVFRTAKRSGVDLIRFSDDEKRIEITIMAGPLLEMTAFASQTKISFLPPEGRSVTLADRNTIAGLFLGALEADLVMESEGPDIQTLYERNGQTRHGLHYQDHSWAMPRGGTQCAAVLLDSEGDHDLIIASRAADESATLQKSCMDSIIQSVQPNVRPTDPK